MLLTFDQGCLYSGPEPIATPTLTVSCDNAIGETCAGLAAAEVVAVAILTAADTCPSTIPTLASRYRQITTTLDCSGSACATLEPLTWKCTSGDACTDVTSAFYLACLYIDSDGDGAAGDAGNTVISSSRLGLTQIYRDSELLTTELTLPEVTDE